MNEKVLIIEHDKESLKKFLTILKDCGCIAEASSSLMEGLQKIKQEYFDCIVMDIGTYDSPDFNSIPLVKAVSPESRIIATTAANSRRLEAGARQYGIFYYYVKSFDLQELKLAVIDALRHRRKEISRERG